MDHEPRQRAHSPWVLPCGSASHAAGLASESKLDRIPYGEASQSLAAGSFNPDIADMSFRVLGRLKDAFKDALFPLTCLMCGQIFVSRRSDRRDVSKSGASFDEAIRTPPSASLFGRLMALYVCPVCSRQYTPIESPCCTCCGVMFKSREGTDHVCGECLGEKRYFGRARAAGVYERALMTVIHAFKYGEKVGLAAPLSLLLLNAYHHFWQDRPMEVLVPVPLFGRRFRKRGFNQVHLAVRHWEDRQGADLPILPRIEREALRRRRSAPPQAGLGRKDRMRNVKGAFELGSPQAILNKRVLVVDDVYTTGATVNECARILLKGGAAAVDVLTMARTL
jgi:ComF family protein